MQQVNVPTAYLRLRALPFTPEIEDFLSQYQKIYVLEQNRDGQLHQLIREHFPQYHSRIKSIVQYDGMPFTPQKNYLKIAQMEGVL